MWVYGPILSTSSLGLRLMTSIASLISARTAPFVICTTLGRETVPEVG